MLPPGARSRGDPSVVRSPRDGDFELPVVRIRWCSSRFFLQSDVALEKKVH